ncbi:unnamed protein product [Urochloa decumbens]|uniref:Uncharacterized protein n=1 Tax=Urochloa decumbens TaxID=240449 RepID=A0ABC8VS92_9POAL
MIRWGKSPAPVTAGAGAGAAGEVAVEKVPKIEFHNLVSRPSIYGLKPAPPRGGGVGAEGDDINKKAEEFIKQRKQWFHRPA